MSDERNGQTPQPDEALRRMLRSIDPMHPGVETTPPSRERLEDIMATAPTKERPAPSRWYAAAAVAVIAVGIGAVAVFGDGGTSATTTVAAQPLELSLGAGDSLASCLPVEAQYLADMPVAFAGTVTAVEGDVISVAVDHWYRGGDAQVVELKAPHGLEALIGGIEFVAGEEYLISATEGNVNYCGFSGPATAELRSLFEEAFSA